MMPAAASALAALLLAQPPGDDDKLGYAMWSLGDVDGDGACDLAVHASTACASDGSCGTVVFVSGCDGRWLGVVPDEAWGVVLGDVDGDGVLDVATAGAGAPEGARVAIVSGKRLVEGAVDPRIRLLEDGRQAFPIGRRDGDGCDDYVVVDQYLPLDRMIGLDERWILGPFTIGSGATGELSTRGEGLVVPWQPEPFHVLGDVDGDGREDVLTGRMLSDARRVYRDVTFWMEVRSGADLSLLYEVAEHVDASMDWRIAAGEDVTGDGVPDFVLGAPGTGDFEEPRPGRLLVCSGVDGSRSGTIEYPGGPAGFDTFGWAVALLGDLTGDGSSEILATAVFGGLHFEGGEAYVLDGADGSPLAVHRGPDYFGQAALALEDVDGDSVRDYAVSMANPYCGARTYPGSAVHVYSGARHELLYVVRP